MKLFTKFLFTLLLTFLYHHTYSQKIYWKRAEGKRLPIPPNGIWLKDNLFIDATEVAHLDWLEFIHYLAKLDTLPDDDIVNKQSVEIELSESTLYIHYDNFGYRIESLGFEYNENNKLFLFHPVVGISYEQALAYSKWRSRIVTKLYNQRLEELGYARRVLFQFRLPTEDEWELAAKNAKLSNSTRFFSKKESRELNKVLQQNNLTKLEWYKISRPTFVCKYPLTHPQNNTPIVLEGANMLGDIAKGERSKLGILHLFGNVAEMLSTKGIAKGGSWVHNAEDCQISKRQTYNAPTEWLGFRNVCEVHVYHKDNFPTDW